MTPVASPAAAEHVRRALALERAHASDAAIAELNAALRREPGHYFARRRLAAILHRLGRDGEALPIARALLAGWRLDAATRLLVLSILAATRQTHDQDALVATVVAEQPDTPRLRRLVRGHCLTRLVAVRDLRRVDVGAAQQDGERYLEHFPDDRRMMRELMLIARRGGDRQAALDAVERLAANDANADLLVELGRETMTAGDATKSEAAFRAAIAIERRHPSAWLGLGDLHHDTGRLADAEGAYRKAVAAAPGFAKAWLRLAVLRGKRDDMAALFATFRAARRCTDDDPSVLYGLARQLVLSGRHADALALLAEARDKGQGDTSQRHLEIEIAIELGTFDRAEEAVTALPDDDGAAKLRLLAKLREGQWRIEEAIAASEAAARLRPQLAWPHASLARLRTLSLEPALARRHLQLQASANAGTLSLQRRSPNPSQSLAGEIVNDLRSDPQVLGDASGALARLDRDGLIAIVRRSPGHTGAAMALMTLLRRSGELVAPGPAEGPSPVPRSICQFWDSPAPETDLVALMDGWPRRHPGWAYRRFDDASARAYLVAHFPAEVLAAYRRARSAAQKSDLFRLAWLLRNGGLYVDADDRCLASVDSVLGTAGLLLWHEHLGSIGNNFVAATPGHPVVAAAFTEAVRNVIEGHGESIWLSTGPGLVTRAFASWLAADTTRLAHLGGSVRVLSKPQLRAVAAPGCKVRYKATERHWSRGPSR